METQGRQTMHGGKAGVLKYILQSVGGVLFWGFLLFLTSGDLNVDLGMGVSWLRPPRDPGVDAGE